MKRINSVLVLFLTITICISASCSKDDIKDYSNLGPNKIFYGANKIMSVNTTIDCNSLNKILTSTIWYGRYTTSFNTNSKGIIDFVDVCRDTNNPDVYPRASYYKFVGKDSLYLYRATYVFEDKRYDLSYSIDSNSNILSFFYKGKAVMEWKLIGLDNGTIAVDGDDFAFHGIFRKYSEIRTVYRPYTDVCSDFSSIGELIDATKATMSEALPVDVWNSKYPTCTYWMENWE